VTGVGFFDEVHRSVRQAPNYLELHPLLSFVGLCRRPPPPPPPAPIVANDAATSR
jgi:hypothetical protein